MSKAKKAPTKKSTPQQALEKGSAIASDERMSALIKEAESELAAIEPRIQELEKLTEELQELKTQKQKLLTFKVSLEAISNNYAKHPIDVNTHKLNNSRQFQFLTSTSSKNSNRHTKQPFLSTTQRSNLDERGTFDPSEAIRQAKRVVRVSSLNYQLFQALVENGGVIDTPAIKQFLLQQDIRQPGTGESFQEVALTSISSRMNYLVRKGLVEADGRGMFIAHVGWSKN
jgi:vacuolar-type H+-ATPase subunit I/STV1